MNLRPTTGTLTARLFENDHVGIPLSVFFDMDIPIQPFEYEGERQEISLQLEFIEVPVSDWRELSNREFTFPVNPAPGYIDSSLYLGGAHHAADVTMIRFGQLNGNLMPVALSIHVDFTREGLDELGEVALDWHTELVFDAAELDGVFGEARRLGVV